LEGGNEEIDESVVFAAHTEYWGQVPDIQTLIIKHYENSDDVYAPLMAGELDMTLGTGPLTNIQVRDIQYNNATHFQVVHSEILQNAVLVLNTNRTPTNDINVRKAIIHGVNKAEFINKEFAGLEQPANELLPLNTPYCDVDLNPKWNYDLEKALLLNCSDEDSSLSGGAIAGIAISAMLLLGMAILIAKMIIQEKRGKPLFSPEPNVCAEPA
jgi:ABC-type transport system substrate-binding protein